MYYTTFTEQFRYLNEGFYKVSIINNVEEYCAKQDDIKNISLISTKSMSNNYLKIYDDLLNK